MGNTTNPEAVETSRSRRSTANADARPALGWRAKWFTDGDPDAPRHDGVLVDDGYLVARICRGVDRQPYGWGWWMIATSRFGDIDIPNGVASTQAEAKRAAEEAYFAFCKVEGAREDFFATTAAREMSSGSWRA